MDDAVLVILGPTATGKSGLALDVAPELEGEIIGADALQAYRYLDIGTAKPTPEERRRVPHHLIDFLEPHESYSAGEFARRARAAVAGIRERGGRPLVVGGSGLYIRALLEGITSIPPVDPRIRRALRRRLAEEGLESLRRELGRKDPATADRLAPGDSQRTLRALEVVLSSGRPLSEWVARRPAGEASLEAVRIGLTLPRSILYDRITRRARRMFEAGWVEEVEGLLRRGFDPSWPAFQAIGYRQIVAFLQGEGTREDALAETIRATRRYAKRQATWFRREREVRWLPADDRSRQRQEIRGLLHGRT